MNRGTSLSWRGYVSTYLARELGASVSTASYLLALYWAAVIGARMALSRLLLRVPGTTTVLVSALVGALGVVLLLAARSQGMAAAALVRGRLRRGHHIPHHARPRRQPL